MKKLLVAGIVIVAGAAAATPYFIGQKAKERFALSHEWLQQELVYPQLTAEAGEFKKGWLKSETSTDFTFTPPKEGAEAIHFTVVHRIDQIPSLGEGALMSVDSELVLPDDVAAKLKEYFKDKPLLSAHTVVNFDGSENSTITSPRYVGPLKGEENLHLDWQGLEGTTSSDAKMEKIAVSLNAPAFRLRADDGLFEVVGLDYNTQLERGRHQLWFGNGDASLDALQFNAVTPKNGPTHLQLQNLAITSAQREDGDLVDIEGKLTLESADINGFTIENGLYDVAYNNLDGDSLYKLNESMKAIMRQQPQDPSMLMTGMVPHLQGLLSKKPEIAIRHLDVDTPMGNIRSSINLALAEPLEEGVMQNPQQLMDILHVDINASLPRPLVIGAISSNARTTVMRVAKAQEKTLTAEEMAEHVNTLTQQQLQSLLAKQLMVEDGANFATEIHYVPHTLTINEQDATPMIQSLLPPPQAPQQPAEQ